MVSRWANFGVAAAVSVGLLLGPSVGTALADEKPHYPVPYTLGTPAASQDPDASPAGSNHWDCKPSDEHPNPVVLVHGLGANQSENWQTMAPLLANEGYCVFSLTYGRNPLAPPGIGGLKKIEDSAEELKGFIRRVLDATAAKKVDIVGHSEGSFMPNYYVKFLGGKKYVDHYVGMTPLWDGTTLVAVAGVEKLAGNLKLGGLESALFKPFCESCREFLRGSDFVKNMNSDGGPAVDGVKYTMIMTKYDELVIPYTSGVLDGKDVTNIVLQDGCPTDYAEHGAVAADPVTGQHILNALDPKHAKPVNCHLVTPVAAIPAYVR
jgi:triacylglycerol esterase/lipase EstA (alpha/beta hydrolase family)